MIVLLRSLAVRWGHVAILTNELGAEVIWVTSRLEHLVADTRLSRTFFPFAIVTSNV